jgi:hypothetical protein
LGTLKVRPAGSERPVDRNPCPAFFVVACAFAATTHAPVAIDSHDKNRSASFSTLAQYWMSCGASQQHSQIAAQHKAYEAASSLQSAFSQNSFVAEGCVEHSNEVAP